MRRSCCTRTASHSAIVASYLAACSSSSSAPTCDATRAPCPAACTYAPGGGLLSCDFAIPSELFDPDYFYCHVEPDFIVANKCGPGDPSRATRPAVPFSEPPSAGCSCWIIRLWTARGVTSRSIPPLWAPERRRTPTCSRVEIEFSRTYKTAPLFLEAQCRRTRVPSACRLYP